MKTDIENRCRALMFHLRTVRIIRRYISQNACEKLVHALVSSRLDYANALLIGLPRDSLKRLQTIQNIAAQIITKTRKYDHITPVLRSLNWLQITNRIEFKVLRLTYRILHGLAPAYLCDLITVKRSTRCLRSSAEINLSIPKTRTKTYGDRAFSVAAPRLWNALPNSLKAELSFNSFKRNLKTHRFKKAYNL